MSLTSGRKKLGKKSRFYLFLGKGEGSIVDTTPLNSPVSFIKYPLLRRNDKSMPVEDNTFILITSAFEFLFEVL